MVDCYGLFFSHSLQGGLHIYFLFVFYVSTVLRWWNFSYTLLRWSSSNSMPSGVDAVWFIVVVCLGWVLELYCFSGTTSINSSTVICRKQHFGFIFNDYEACNIYNSSGCMNFILHTVFITLDSCSDRFPCFMSLLNITLDSPFKF